MSEHKEPIPSRIYNASVGGHIAGADDIIDDKSGLTLDELIGNKDYDIASHSGMGRITLKKNIVDGVNTLTQSMINRPNTIYIIQYDFDLGGETVEIPANCVLQFEGGSLSNGTITGQNTKLEGNVKICNISGTFSNDIIYTSWFIGNPTDIFNCISASENVLFVDKDITLNGSLVTLNSLKIDGDGFSVINYPNKIIFTGNELSIKNVNIRNINSDSENIFINITGNSRNIYVELYNVDFDGGAICRRFINRGGNTVSSVNAKINISSCKIYNVLEFCIRYADCCTGIVKDCEFYNVGSVNVQNFWQTALQLGRYDNETGEQYLCNYAEVIGNRFHDIQCTYSIEDDSKETHGILLYGNNNIVKDNFVDEIVSNQGLPGNDTEGIYLKGSFNTISGNTLRYACGDRTSDGSITIKLIESVASNNVVKNNKIYTKCGNGITLYGQTSFIQDNIIVQEGSQSKCGIDISYAEDISVYDNIYVDKVTSGINNSSCFVIVNKNVNGVLLKGNNIRCACIVNAYDDVTLENNTIKAIGYDKSDIRYDTLINSVVPNASNTDMPVVTLKGNHFVIANRTNTYSIITSNAKIVSIANSWQIKNCYYRSFVRAINDFTINVGEADEEVIDGECLSINDIFDYSENLSVFLSKAAYNNYHENYFKPTTIVNLLTLNKKFSYPNCLFATSINKADKRIGAFADKPALDSDMAGYVYYDTTYNRFIVWNGSAWKDAIGNAVGTKYLQRLENEATNGNIPMFYNNGYIKDSGKALSDIVTKSGTIVSGNVPEFDGTTGAVKDSGKAATNIP